MPKTVSFIKRNYLTDVTKVVEGLRREEMDRADLAQQSPPRPVGRENQVLVVVRDVFSAGVRRPAREVRVVRLQELRRHPRRRGHHDVHAPEPEVHQRPVGSSQPR